MNRINTGGYGHRIRYSHGLWFISWKYDVRAPSRRFRMVRRFERATNEAGALRFSEKHGVPMPECPCVSAGKMEDVR